MKKIMMILISMFILVFMFGCKKETIEIQILYNHDIMYVGEHQTLTYKLIPEKDYNLNFTWTSSDEQVISIDQQGNCQALNTGKTTISIACKEKTSMISTMDIFVISLPKEQESTITTEKTILDVVIDKTNLQDSLDKVTITVTLTARKDFTAILSTGSFKQQGLIEIRLVKATSENQYDSLYSELYNIAVTDDEYEFSLSSGETVIRSLQFATLPFVYFMGDEITAPRGIYKVQVRVAMLNEPWLDTGLEIVVL